MNNLFKTLEVSSIFSAIKRACKWEHDSYYWNFDTEWAWIKDELHKCDTKIEQLEQENAKLKDQLKDADSVIEFYGDLCPSSDLLFCGDNPSDKKAREYLAKYNNKGGIE